MIFEVRGVSKSLTAESAGVGFVFNVRSFVKSQTPLREETLAANYTRVGVLPAVYSTNIQMHKLWQKPCKENEYINSIKRTKLYKNFR